MTTKSMKEMLTDIATEADDGTAAGADLASTIRCIRDDENYGTDDALRTAAVQAVEAFVEKGNLALSQLRGDDAGGEEAEDGVFEIMVRLEIEADDASEAYDAVDRVLDEGVFQDAINDRDVEVTSAVVLTE